MNLIDLGFGCWIPADHISALYDCTDYFGYKLRKKYRKSGEAMDVSAGRGFKSLIEMDSGKVFISAYPPQVLLAKAEQREMTAEEHNLMDTIDNKLFGRGNNFFYKSARTHRNDKKDDEEDV